MPSGYCALRGLVNFPIVSYYEVGTILTPNHAHSAMMVVFSLFPGGVLQVWDVIQHGYWHAHSLEYTGTTTARTLEWMRMPGDLVFIFAGSAPLAIAAVKAWLGVRRSSSLRNDVNVREAHARRGSH